MRTRSENTLILTTRFGLLTIVVGLLGSSIAGADDSRNSFPDEQVATDVATESGLIADSWSELVGFRTSDERYVGPYHGTLLPDGRVVMLGWIRPTEVPPPGADITDLERIAYTIEPPRLSDPLPSEMTVTPIDVPLDILGDTNEPWYTFDYLNCSGHALTSEGDFFTAGGSRVFYNLDLEQVTQHGLTYATLFDGTTWTRLAGEIPGDGETLANERWYPTVTLLPDRRMLVTSGIDLVRSAGATVLSPNRSVAAYDLDDGTWELLSEHGDAPPEIWNPDYTHAFVLPRPIADYDLVMLGDDGVPVYFSTTREDPWRVGPKRRPDSVPGDSPNDGASSLLLPIRRQSGEWGYENGSLLVVGGDLDTSAVSHIDVYDTVRRLWAPRITLEAPRHHPGTIILPDGRLLVITGHDAVGGPGFAEYVDPANGFAHSRGAAEAAEIRGYHSVAVLMPDGRVLVSGGNDGDNAGAEKPNFRYYSPDYMSLPRPQITSAPQTLGHGQTFSLSWLQGEPGQELREVVLLALGSMTHSIDSQQRYVQLEIVSQSPGEASVRVPPLPSIVPPGHYLLFALDADRVPSIAQFLKVQ